MCGVGTWSVYESVLSRGSWEDRGGVRVRFESGFVGGSWREEYDERSGLIRVRQLCNRNSFIKQDEGHKSYQRYATSTRICALRYSLNDLGIASDKDRHIVQNFELVTTSDFDSESVNSDCFWSYTS